MTQVTRLEVVRDLKRMKLPLNMVVEDRTFSEKFTTDWVALTNAHTSS
jgi:hypothetical protein